MAGMNSIGSLGMPEYQFKSAMVNSSGFAAQGTGTAKQFSDKHVEEHLTRPQSDGVTLSDNATKSLSEENEQVSEQQAQKEQQEAAKADQQENKLTEQRQKVSSGFAAMAQGKGKEANKASSKPMKPFYHFAKPKDGAAAADSSDSDYKQLMEDLNQAATLGILESEAKKMMAQRGASRSAQGMADLKDGNTIKPSEYQGKLTEVEKTELDETRTLELDKVMNRTPEEILADVPPQFQATAKIMVAGQIDQAGKPKEALTQLKSEPRTESSMMQLLPAEPVGEIELAEAPEALPISFEE